MGLYIYTIPAKYEIVTEVAEFFFFFLLNGYNHPMLLLCQGGQVIRSLKEHDSWVVNVHFTGKMGGHEMISASAKGDIRYGKMKSKLYLFM